jgi:hypothetical protein
MILTTKIQDLQDRELKLLVSALIESCSLVMGKKSEVGVKISNRKTGRVLGYFDPITKNICLYRKSITTVNEFVKVFIHEWQHSLQKKLKKKYSKFDYKYGYRKNPFEVEAQSEKIYKSLVWKMTKTFINDLI